MLLKDFKLTVQKWVERGLAHENVKYKTRSLSVKLIPTAAAVMTLLLTRKLGESAIAGVLSTAAEAFIGYLKVRDPMLWGGEKYLSFVSDWYTF